MYNVFQPFTVRFYYIHLFFCSPQDEYLIEATEPEVTLEELEQILEPAILEYYENNNSQEFLVCYRLGTSKYVPIL